MTPSRHHWSLAHSIYREERLSVRKRDSRKRALGTRAPMAIPQDREQAHVEALIAQPRIEAFDKAILHRRVRCSATRSVAPPARLR
jgi:hypothetical protein